MAYKADCAVVLAPLKVAFLGKGDDKRLDPWYGSLSCLPNVIADFMQGSYHGTSQINIKNHFFSSRLSQCSFLCLQLLTHIAFFYSNSIQNLKIGICN